MGVASRQLLPRSGMGDCIRGQQDTYVCDLLSLDPLTILVERWAACPGLCYVY